MMRRFSVLGLGALLLACATPLRPASASPQPGSATTTTAKPAPAAQAAPSATPPATSSGTKPAPTPSALPPTDYGKLHITKPQGPMHGFVIQFSAGPEWSATDEAAAQAMARNGAYVAGVSRGPYLAQVDPNPDHCDYMEGDVETLGRQIQRALKQEVLFPPILAGIGPGGMLARRVLSLAPVHTLTGAIAVDPVTDPSIKKLICGDTTTKPNGIWHIAAHPAWHGDEKFATVQRISADQSSAKALAALARPLMSGPAPAVDKLADLSLVPMHGSNDHGMLAIVLSGDGGWRDIDRTIAHKLHNEGISVIGFDTLEYFWSARTPEQTAKDLARVIRTYTARWHIKHVALIGYSFGADVLPAAYNRLPQDLRPEINLLSLLALSKGADFEIRIVGWFGAPPSKHALPTLPELKKIPADKIQCVYGIKDVADSACPALEKTGAQVIRTTGGHHFDGHYNVLTARILDAWKKRIGH